MRKHEIVESIVMSVCDAFHVDDWRELQDSRKYWRHSAARMTVICLLSKHIGCSMADTKDYFMTMKMRHTCTSAFSELERHKKKPSVELRYNKTLTLVENYFKVQTPNKFIYLQSKIDEGKEQVFTEDFCLRGEEVGTEEKGKAIQAFIKKNNQLAKRLMSCEETVGTYQAAI